MPLLPTAQQTCKHSWAVVSSISMPWASRWLTPEEVAIALDPQRGEPLFLTNAEPGLIGDSLFVCFVFRTLLEPLPGEGGERRSAWICA